MLRYSFNLMLESKAVEDAVETTLNEGYRTPDIWIEGDKKVGTEEMGNTIIQKLKR